MKLNIILLFALLNMFSACNRSSEKLETVSEIERLKNEVEILNSKLTANQKNIDSLTNKGISDKENINISNKAFSKVFNLMVNSLKLDENSIFNELFGSFLFSKGIRNDLNRSTEFISEYFGNAEVELITNLLKEDDFYFKARLNIMVEGLLIAHDELDKNKQLLNQAENCKYDYVEYHELLNSSCSKKIHFITQMLGERNNIDSPFKFYSFWVRRQSEGNSEIVYTLLNKVHSKITKINRTNLFSFDKDTIASQIMEETYSTDDFNETTFNFLVVELKVGIVPFEDYIAYDPIFIPRKLEPGEECFVSVHYVDREIDTPDYMGKLNKIYSDFERTPDNISKVFNEKMLNHIALLFNMNFLPKDYKTYGLLNGLLMTYEDMHDSDCERLYRCIELKDLDYFKNVNECDEAFKNQISNRVKNYVTSTPYVQYYDNTGAGYNKRLFYLYSFWARRYNEGNKEAVYNILKRLNEKIR